MDNLAHSLVGLAAAKAGLEKLSPAATTVCILAANAPDIDFIAVFFGDRWTLLHHHRGFSHSLLGTLLFGLFIPIVFYLVDQVVVRIRGGTARLKFRGLLIASLATVATHPLLDWTNSYGIRPLLPWSGRWFYGDLAFIVDPLLWLIMGAAAFLLTSRSKLQITLWGLLATLISALVTFATLRGRSAHPLILLTLWFGSLFLIVISRRLDFGRLLDRKLALLAFGCLVAYWGVLGVIHFVALNDARVQATLMAQQRREEVVRVAATPTLVNPLVWRCVVETNKAVQRFDLSLTASQGQLSNIVLYEKLDSDKLQVVEFAESDRRAKLFLEFARFPVEQIVGDCATETLVQFADLRYTEPGPSRGAFSVEVPVTCPTVSDGR